MKSKRSINAIVAVAFAFALILSSGAKASSLLGFDRDLAPRTASERSAGLFDQVSAWLAGAWNRLTGTFAEETTTPPPPTTSSTCDAGWGLDPEGCPKG
jgi:hypothetical protein